MRQRFKITVVGGAFKKGFGHGHELVVGRNAVLKLHTGGLFGSVQTFRPRDIVHVEEVSADSSGNAIGAVGGAVVGGVLAGPLGLAAGFLAGAQGIKQVTFRCQFKDGRTVMATIDKPGYMELLGAITTAGGR